MKKDAAANETANHPGTNPKGRRNQSFRSFGRHQGRGTTSDERRVLSDNHPSETRAGQMKGNPGDNQTEASQRASDEATTNKKP